MKNGIYFLLIIWLLGACGPGAAPEPSIATLEPIATVVSEVAQGEPTAEQIVDPVSPLAPPVSPLAPPEAVDLSWDSAAEAPLISATYCCGFVPQVVAWNYIAAATVWGDGQFVWTVQQDDGTRQVLQGQLSAAQIENLLQQAQNEGFFTWEDRYEDRTIADAPDKCLTIALPQQTKQVCEYVKGAPPAFHQLYDAVVNGMGGAGAEFVPERGYLYVFALEGVAASVPVDVEWSAAEMGFSLAEVGEGRWIEGPALAKAWAIVNAQWQGMVIQEGEAFYQIAVQVPGLGLLALPPQ